MNSTDPWPLDYAPARDRFRRAADRLGASLDAWSVGPPGMDLTIDAARIGPDDAPGLVVVSSGLHGVEAPLGSAVQSGWLEGEGPRALPAGVAVLMLHALNPFGYAVGRRFDAGNVDLNRNFLPPGEPYRGHHPLYARLDHLLNPPRPPGPIDELLFLPRAAWVNLRHGAREVKQAVAEGQYDFPLGLFFGGLGPSATARLLDATLGPLIGAATAVVHLDFHTGLGPWKTFALLVDEPPEDPVTLRLARTFGPSRVAPWSPGGIAYRSRGTFGAWCTSRFGVPGRTYDYACTEFGTHAGTAVVAALRLENQARHYSPPDSPPLRRAVSLLRDRFTPPDPSWRRWALAEGLNLLDLALSHVSAVAIAPGNRPGIPD